MEVDYQQRTRRLLYRLRKQMNGDALDRMLCYGEPYVRNYGVQIYALRDIAREVGVDHALADHLRLSDIRELRIIALWIADVESLDSATIAPWLDTFTNSEMAEQAAHALLSRFGALAELLAKAELFAQPFVAYALLLAAARQGVDDTALVSNAVVAAVEHNPDNALVARAAATWLSALEAPEMLLEGLPDTPTSRALHRELSWRI